MLILRYAGKRRGVLGSPPPPSYLGRGLNIYRQIGIDMYTEHTKDAHIKHEHTHTVTEIKSNTLSHTNNRE